MSDVVLVGSDRCGLDDLFLDYGAEAERGRLGLGPGWSRRWTGTWRTSDGEVACAARDLGEIPVAGCVPVRRFTWRQRHRPGLQFMVSTGRLHGFESLEERSLLLALDFTGEVEEVLSQPFRLKFEAAGGETGEHVPDFLAVFRDGSQGRTRRLRRSTRHRDRDDRAYAPEDRIDEAANHHRRQRHLHLGAGHPPAADDGRPKDRVGYPVWIADRGTGTRRYATDPAGGPAR